MISMFYYFYLNLLSLILMVLMVLIGVAFLTLLERKVLGYIQDRKGPNKVGFKGLLQPFSDALKLLSKEMFFIFKSNYLMYLISPVLVFSLSMMLWLVFPFMMNLYSFNYSFLFLICCLSVSSYFIVIIGWSSNSNYSMLGIIRSVSQSISYEVSLILLMFSLIILIESFSFKDFVYNFFLIVLLIPLYMLIMISILVELNRTPFDLIEGESELVSGFNIEYFGGNFTLIFLSEYMNIIFMSMLMVVMFFGVKLDSFIFMLLFLMKVFFIIWIRGVLPRIRYDNLMYMCWKSFLPISLNYLIFIFSFKMYLLI